MPEPVRFFSLVMTERVAGHHHFSRRGAVSANYRLAFLAKALCRYLDDQGIPPAVSDGGPTARLFGPRESFVDGRDEERSDGSVIRWIAWTMTPLIAAQLARVAPHLSHRQEEHLLEAAYGSRLDPDYPLPRLDVENGRVADLTVLRATGHRSLKAHRRLQAAPSALQRA